MRRNWLRMGPWLTVLALAFLLSEGTAAASKSKKALVDLNTASQKELEELPGVGEATAKKIIAGRPYKSVSDLSKAGVSESTISKIRKQVTVSTASSPSKAEPASKSAEPMKSSSSSAMRQAEKAAPAAAKAAGGRIDLNTASRKELEDLPGVGAATATKIIGGRPYSSVSELSRAGVPAATVEKISPLVTVGKRTAAVEPGPPARPAGTFPGDTSRSMAPGPGRSSAAPEGAPSGAPAGSMARVPGRTAANPEAGPPQQPPVKGMVWVNTETKVFHREGDHWYGNTKHGKFMTEADAVKAGYRESKQKVAR